jgi:uncharacterized membrane protein YdjX (TVP38/TMEM64 family)
MENSIFSNFSKRDVLIAAAVVVAAVLLLAWAVPALTSDWFRAFVENLGPWGPAAIVLFTALSQIIAPMPGSPGVVVGIAVYGWAEARWYTYIGSLLSAVIAFWIARKFGRPWVRKLVGKKGLEEVDEFTTVEGTEALLVARLIGFHLYDYISYAGGLTNMGFEKYFIITAIAAGVSNLGYMELFRSVDFTTVRGFLIWYGSVVLLFPVLGLLVKVYIRRKKRLKSRSTDALINE